MKILTVLLATLLLMCGSFSCEKEEFGGVTFYVKNAGDRQIFDHISVEVGEVTGNFFTPQSQNLTLANCGKGQAHTLYLKLSPGNYNYKATGSKSSWSGTLSVKNGDCLTIELNYP